MKNKFTSIFGLLIVLVIMLAINLLASLIFSNVKVDLTEEKLYTLSEGTKNILAGLEDQITAKLYYSKTAAKDIPPFKTYANRVIEVLKEYAQLSGGKIQLEIIDPRPDTEEQEWADRYGLQAVPVSNTETVYLGLALRDESGNEQSIAFFRPDREPFIEYDVTKAIQQVSRAARKKIGVISSLPLFGAAPPPNPLLRQQSEQGPWFAIRQLRQAGFEVEEIDATEQEIPAGLDLLLVVHPKNISDGLQYSIDQYILGGGNAIVFVDPFCEADQQQSAGMDFQMRAQMSYNSDLPQLFKAWGLQLAAGGPGPGAGAPAGQKIVADPNLALTVQGYDGRPAKMIIWLSLGEDNRNKDEIVTAQLENLMLASAGKLEKTGADDRLQYTPLLTTSAEAAVLDDFMLKFGMNPDALNKDFQPGSVEIPLAWKIQGKFKTAFPAGKPAAAAESKDEAAVMGPEPSNQLTESKADSTVIVVADADMLSNRMSVNVQRFFGQEIATLINDNLSFLDNAVENLTGSQDLISLRSRGKSQRPFTKVLEIERAAQEKWRAEEDRLSEKIEAANKRLNEIKQGTDERQILNQALVTEIEKIREERAGMQKQLREIRKNLREDVERLAARLKLINIALIPLLVIALGGAIALSKTLRRRSA